ncbi:polysaccharide biosynthesis tyrosine autokinase [Tessaracoccus antarcticus]|uniref:non-specific protein-tyrosine kinase n=1 Tax=Tessaracoccus antarcticus TaxID=2479848 RepID=A0A3M0GWZ7_9ACTN|nr:polysaccharide biosynthesis tyrosine autokinase [Tessaracoccus antarcticus]RMB61886.1 polysaccharide biosynthesis tyrosine autokinase [Tessaracoccus antarcticus]
MELQQYLLIVRRYWRSAIATLLLCVVIAAAVTLTQKPTYTASAALFLAVESGDTAGDLAQGATYAERQVKSFVSVATTAVVLQPVIDELKLDMTSTQLGKKLTVTSPTATTLIDVTSTDGDPAQAALLANTVADSLQKAVEKLSPAGVNGAKLVTATAIDPALAPTQPTAPRPTVNLALGLVLGMLLGVGQAVLRSVLDTRVRTVDDLENLTEAPLLGAIGHVDAPSDRALETEGQHWSNAEAYRRLRTNVGFVGLGGERRPSMVVTSSVGAEGKTETVVNLARVLAQAGESVLLIDADLRRPQVANRMRLDSEFGLSEVLSGKGSLQDMVIDVVPGSLAVLPAGTVPPNPSELLGSEAMAHLLATVERQYDHVLFDAPPLLPVTDAVVLAGQTAGAIMVARSGKVKRPEFEAAVGLLESGSVTLLGVVLNDAPANGSGSYGGYYAEYTSVPASDSVKAKREPVRARKRTNKVAEPVLEHQS